MALIRGAKHHKTLCPLLLLNFPVLLCFLSVMFLYLSCPLTCVQHSVNLQTVSFLLVDNSNYMYGLHMKRNGTKAGCLNRKITQVALVFKCFVLFCFF